MSEPGFPCGFCGVRPDVECPHRPGDESWTPPKGAPKVDGRKLLVGTLNPGGNYRMAHRVRKL